MSDLASTTDIELVSAFRAGDTYAFSGIYDRYADHVYSYSLAMLQDPAAARRATRDVFVSTAEQLEAGEGSGPMRPKLFATAHETVRSFSGEMYEPDGEEPPLSTSDVDSAGDPSSRLRDQVWGSLDGLGQRHRELLVLDLVEGMGSGEAAEVVRAKEEDVAEISSRLRSHAERALGPLLIAEFGNDECGDLDGLIDGSNGGLPPETRARLGKHIGGCVDCQGRRSQLIGTENVLARILLTSAPTGLRDEVLDQVIVEIDPIGASPAVPAAPPPAVSDPAPVPPPAVAATSEPHQLSDPVMYVVFGVMTLALGLIGMAVSARFTPMGAPGSPPAAAPLVATSTTTTTIGSDTTSPEPSTVTTPAPSAAAAAITVSTGTVDFGDDATVGELEIANTGGQVGEFTVTSSSESVILAVGGGELGPRESTSFSLNLDRETIPEGDIAETVTVSWAGGAHEVAVVGTHLDNPILHNPQASPASVQVDEGSACSPTRTTISVRIRDSSPFVAVVRWSPDGGGVREVEMSDIGGDMFSAEIGPFTAAQSTSVRIVATDELGNAGGATVGVIVNPCP